MKQKRIPTVVSGGQTGADRAAFDFALENNFEIAGWIPKNRLAEDGRIPEKYKNLCETGTENSAERTEINVRDSDATLILSHGELTGGSHLTKQFAEKYQKPFLHIDFLALSFDEAVKRTKEWLILIDCKKLNVAGSRSSEDPKIYAKTKRLLENLLS
ncbi:MAG: putative molybdenum carrier protein [Acidobacteria bacterium]|nr:putative molybdenum carrier protein [Acidobacteriota bacterium]